MTRREESLNKEHFSSILVHTLTFLTFSTRSILSFASPPERRCQSEVFAAGIRRDEYGVAGVVDDYFWLFVRKVGRMNGHDVPPYSVVGHGGDHGEANLTG